MNMSQDGRVFHELKPAIDDGGDLVQSLKGVVLPGFLQLPSQVFPAALPKDGQSAFGIDPGIPHVEEVHFAVFPHPAAIGAPATSGRLFTIRLLESIATSGYVKAGRQALHVPFPRSGQCLVKVVDVEEQLPLRTGVDAEVAQVSVAAELRPKDG